MKALGPISRNPRGSVNGPVNPEHPANVLSPIDSISLGRIKDVKPVHPKKATGPILRNSRDRVNEPVNPEHPRKALSPIEVRDEGSVREPVKPEHLSNVLFPIDFSLYGRIKAVKPEHPEKALASR